MKKVGLPPKKWTPNFERSSRKPNPRAQKELEGEGGASRILTPHLLILQHHRHHPLRRRIERSPKLKTRLHPRRPLDRRLGQRQIHLMQRETQAPIGINREPKAEFRRRAILRLRQQRSIRKARRDLPRRARNAGISVSKPLAIRSGEVRRTRSATGLPVPPTR